MLIKKLSLQAEVSNACLITNNEWDILTSTLSNKWIYNLFIISFYFNFFTRFARFVMFGSQYALPTPIPTEREDIVRLVVVT